MHSSIFVFVNGIRLNTVVGMSQDFLHWIIFGLSGYHIFRAKLFVLTVLSEVILADLCLTAHGNRRAPVNPLTLHARTIASTVEHLRRSILSQYNQRFAQQFFKVYGSGKSSFTGGRITYRILVLPYAMVDLVG